MSENGTRIEHVRYRLPSGKERAIYSRYIEGAGVMFDLPVPYRYDEPVRTVAHEIIDPYSLDGVVIEHMCKLAEQQDAKILWTRPGLLFDS
jgi:hypothetical protein